MRRILIGLSIVSLSLFTAAACHEGSILHPATGPGTEYPCGLHGISCGNNMCCDDHEVCGYKGAFSTCPEGSCCYTGDNWVGAPLEGGVSDAGAKKNNHPQNPER